MKEKPSWFRGVIEGGVTQRENAGRPVRQVDSLESITPQRLLDLWIGLTRNLPEDWNQHINRALVTKLRPIVRKYSVAELYLHLSSPQLWERPSFARALMDEIKMRIERKEFQADEEN